MTWAKLDDHFPDHPKVMRAGSDAAWLHVCVICYCARHLTDGFIPKEAVSTVSTLRDSDCAAVRLVEVGLWHDRGSDYEVHDYLTYNPSRAQVLAEREKAKERRSKSGQRGGRTSGERRATKPRRTEAPTRPDVPPEHEKPPRRNPLFDALAECWPAQTKAEKAKIATALRELAGADDVTPDALRSRSKRLQAKAKAEGWNSTTVLALPGRWTELANTTPTPALNGNGQQYVGPAEIKRCSGCGYYEADCLCGAEIHDFKKARTA